MTPFVLGVIPARSGSKGVVNKNVRSLGGKPLILHTIEASRSSRLLSDFLVSTDAEAIAKVVRVDGAQVPFLRPAALSGDDVPSIDAVIHAVSWYEGHHHRTVDIVALLQPTSPLRTAEDIDVAIGLFTASGGESLVSCYDAGNTHPRIMYTLEGGRLQPLLRDGAAPLRRQEMAPVYVRNGAIYVATRRLVMDSRKMYEDMPAAYIMPRERSINIDEPFDLELAECLLRGRKA